jgi:hypothetical protein
MTYYSGWVARHPFFLNEVPQEKSDLVTEIAGEFEGFHPDDFRNTEEEAINLERNYLLEERDQALTDLDLLSKPYTSPKGTTYICPNELIQVWRSEARKKLAIAEKGLQLLARAS